MADEIISSEIGRFIPSFSSGGIITVVLVVLGLMLVAGLLIWGFYWFMQYLKFNKKIVLFRKVGNEIVPVARDKGQFARIGKAGDYWCKLKKFKKTLPRPRRQVEKNTYWFYEREDGEWVNFTLNDFDDGMKKAGAYFVDEDMRLQRLGIQKNLQERFQKVTFWQQYGGLIMNTLFLLVVTILLIVLFREMRGVWAGAGEMATAVRDMAVQVENIARRVGGGTQVVESFIPLILFKMWRDSR